MVKLKFGKWSLIIFSLIIIGFFVFQYVIPAVITKPKSVTIPPRVTTVPKPHIPLGIELSTMQILGIIVGIVVILALVVFLFVRFQAVKMAT